MLAFLKAMLFGVVAGLVGCYRGLTVQGGPKGVGIAVNETVVYVFIALFPVAAVRRFYALALPSSHLWQTLLIGAAGIVALVAFWEISGRLRSSL